MDELDRVRVTVLPGGRVDRRNAAAYVGRKRQTLASWAKDGIGPAYQLINGRAYYSIEELERFMGAGIAA